VDVGRPTAPHHPGMCARARRAIPKGAIGCATYHSVCAPGVLLDVFAPIRRRWLGRLDAHVVVAEACIGSLTPYFPYDYRIIPNGISLERFRPDNLPLAQYMDGMQNILFVGRFEKRKGAKYLLRAIPSIRERHPNTRFIFACVAAACLALKFLFHIHFSYFGWGFYVDVVLAAALVYFAAQSRSAAPVGMSTPSRTAPPPPPVRPTAVHSALISQPSREPPSARPRAQSRRRPLHPMTIDTPIR